VEGRVAGTIAPGSAICASSWGRLPVQRDDDLGPNLRSANATKATIGSSIKLHQLTILGKGPRTNSDMRPEKMMLRSNVVVHSQNGKLWIRVAQLSYCPLEDGRPTRNLALHQGGEWLLTSFRPARNVAADIE